MNGTRPFCLYWLGWPETTLCRFQVVPGIMASRLDPGDSPFYITVPFGRRWLPSSGEVLGRCSREGLRLCTRPGNLGRVAEWPCSGLQIRVRRFDSGLGLHIPPPDAEQSAYPAKVGPVQGVTVRSRETRAPFPGSSVVEQAAVNRGVTGSSPVAGAI